MKRLKIGLLLEPPPLRTATDARGVLTISSKAFNEYSGCQRYATNSGSSRGVDRSLPQRFWEKVDRNGPVAANMDTRCWLWTGYTTKSGYGQFKWEGKTIKAHRASFLLTYGSEPEVVCHRCNCRNCVRPDHLYAGNSETNLLDIMRERIRREAAS